VDNVVVPTARYVLCLALLLAAGLALFRGPVRSDYRRFGRLRTVTGLMEWAAALAIFAFPYLFNPPCWALVWSCPTAGPAWARILGLSLIAFGALLSFGSMAWLGMRRSTGLEVDIVFERGLYRWTRNPQVLFGMAMPLGVVCLWPSAYALGWLVTSMAVFHAMVLTEEEHLLRVHGDAYRDYCRRVPRYLGRSATGAGRAL
jgi:protein-S-isoprenylcysteine O-methyltransferase Ste14